jgi:predicted alpha-1,6-mannanase (GH76 family)
METLGRTAADQIDWSAPRRCASQRTHQVRRHAVQQINRNIELIRYRRFGDDLLLLELATRRVPARPSR